ncbi:MAG: hypothetical protein OSJ45_09915 [Lachnospiraceae bacterium]|nr:hypothetical protein [Lachnospiraceae bacterium]
MSQQKDIVEKSVKEVEEVVGLFYQQKLQEALAKFEVVIGGMMTAIDELFTFRAEHEEFSLDEVKITRTLKDAMGALQDGDMVLLADILQYDYLEYMHELLDNMK